MSARRFARLRAQQRRVRSALLRANEEMEVEQTGYTEDPEGPGQIKAEPVTLRVKGRVEQRAEDHLIVRLPAVGPRCQPLALKQGDLVRIGGCEHRVDEPGPQGPDEMPLCYLATLEK